MAKDVVINGRTVKGWYTRGGARIPIFEDGSIGKNQNKKKYDHIKASEDQLKRLNEWEDVYDTYDKQMQKANEIDFQKEWNKGLKKSIDMEKDNYARRKANGDSVENLSNMNRNIQEMELQLQKEESNLKGKTLSQRAREIDKINNNAKEPTFEEKRKYLKQKGIDELNNFTKDDDDTFIKKEYDRQKAKEIDKVNSKNEQYDAYKGTPYERKYNSVEERYNKDKSFRDLLKKEYNKTLDATKKEIRSYLESDWKDQDKIGTRDDLYKLINENYYNVDKKDFDKLYDKEEFNYRKEIGGRIQKPGNNYEKWLASGKDNKYIPTDNNVREQKYDEAVKKGTFTEKEAKGMKDYEKWQRGEMSSKDYNNGSLAKMSESELRSLASQYGLKSEGLSKKQLMAELISVFNK